MGPQSVISWLLNEATESLVLRTIGTGSNFSAATPRSVRQESAPVNEEKVFREETVHHRERAFAGHEHDPGSQQQSANISSRGKPRNIDIPT